jgi:hypothetical protein
MYMQSYLKLEGSKFLLYLNFPYQVELFNSGKKTILIMNRGQTQILKI